MTKVTKTEKILRKATGKWEKFLAEGAFNKAPVNEMTMGERGMQDAQDGNPPSKIGGGLEDYMAAYNAVMKKMGKEPLPIVQPDQAYLDALQRGNLEEMGPATGHVEGTDAAGVIRQIAADLNEVSGVMNNASSTTTASEFAGFIQAKAAELLEAADELGIDGSELYDIDEAVSGKEQYYLKQQNRAKGAAMALLNAEQERLNTDYILQQANIVVDAMVALERMVSSDSIDERSEDDERDLEPPVKYGSGAKLEFDPKEQEFYDRKRDMYIYDKEEEDNLTKEGNPSSFSMRTTHSSDPEMDQVMDIAADMLELGARSRVPVSLVGVESALQKQGFDTKMDKGMLIVDDKYVIADKSSLPASAQKISFTKYAADYLSNLQGEQQDLPMDEQENPDFVTSYSADPHLDQIEDYALTVIEKGGNLRQLEDVLNRDGFATFLNGDVLTIDDEFFVGNEENFDISPDEDVRRLTGSNLVVGRTK